MVIQLRKLLLFLLENYKQNQYLKEKKLLLNLALNNEVYPKKIRNHITNQWHLFEITDIVMNMLNENDDEIKDIADKISKIVFNIINDTL